MLNPQVIHNTSQKHLFTWQKPFLLGSSSISSSSSSTSHNFGQKTSFEKRSAKVNKSHKNNGHRGRDATRRVRAVLDEKTGTSSAAFGFGKNTRVKVIVTVKPTADTGVAVVDAGLTAVRKGLDDLVTKPLGDLVTKGMDDLTDVVVGGVHLELVAAELGPINGDEKPTLKGTGKIRKNSKEEMVYEADFDISEKFGDVGAILVENEHHSEIFIKEIVLEGFLFDDPLIFSSEGRVAPQEKRIFFSSKSYLPSKTPSGLKKYRINELETLRGDGTGERKKSDRIYDYDVYNDLGDPDQNHDMARPILGGSKKYPYPRRCRTGRPKTNQDPLSESRTSIFDIYVPRDEDFSGIKKGTFYGNLFETAVHGASPALEGFIQNRAKRFPYFTEIDSLFNEGIHIPPVNQSVLDLIPNLIKAAVDTGNNILLFDTPEFIDRDKFAWLRDVEFSRQILAGINPCLIELVKEWPLKSKLDTKVYGPAKSAITAELVEQQIRGVMTVEEALKQKRLFMLDYHDLLLPFVERVRKQEGTTLYGSRTLFFLTPDNTLTPVAIELVCPPIDGKPQYKEVFTPCWSSTRMWLWKLARAHVLAHDSGIHELVSHWLRTHCCTEPYIIATNRQLSEMHPIYRLLRPHFRYTMEINALARCALISAGGVIEQSFSPLKYSMELSSVAYDKMWRFDLQALPADLIHRGMAEPDPADPNKLKLTITDYPFANDGLDLWGHLKEWVTAYVTHYYPGAESIQSDEELQAWWTEIRTVGHADKKDEPWWPNLNTPDDLIGIITTIIWVTSAHHAAVNFGQYDLAGYFPNRPTIARTTMPTEDRSNEERWQQFKRRPETELLSCFPSQYQATLVMVVLNLLSSHSPDEEYLGDMVEPAWVTDPAIKAAFEKFQGRLKELEAEIDRRNIDENLKNRNGAGVVPYELLKPNSGPGVTSKGVPYSISI